ncbi:MAG TPA: amidohydrolase family protein [Stellaceae bacterium]|nr:amidohydrolase family protein [Stellaceae bacterium]
MAADTGGNRYVDVHHHLSTASYVDLVSGKANLPERQRQMLLNGSPAKSLEDMDRAGVKTSMISLTTPGVWFGDDAAARKLARETNDHFATVIADHPGRYGLFAVLPLPDIDGALKEIAYALDQLKADGIGLYTSYRDKHLGDASFTPVLAELNRRKALVYTHPVRPVCCAELLPEITESAIEYGTDTTRTIASLVFSGAATRFPGIRWIFSHAGGTMPFLIGRFIGLAQSAQFAQRLPQGVLPLLRSFYYDTAQVALPGTMASLMKLVAASQVLFGTDFPFRAAHEHVSGLAECGFSADELAQIAHLNAAGLIPRVRG